MTASATDDDKPNAAFVTLEEARAKERDARRLRNAGRNDEALDAYNEARDLYADSGLQYSRDGTMADDVMGAIKRCDAIVSNIRHPKEQRAAAVTSRPNCLACDKPLRRYKVDGRTFSDGTPREWGDYGDNRFCGLRCGHDWACQHAALPTRKAKK
ncbi:MAG TPA: hypothetical protein VLE97_06655 [Gaiellaceae bacterium]|nr:hypothetical protein [Gaiellaceae bacterium]